MNLKLTTQTTLIHIQANLGKRIRALRHRKVWSQTEMAALCGIHVSHLSKLERGGANASLSTLVAVAQVLRVNIPDLFQDDDFLDPGDGPQAALAETTQRPVLKPQSEQVRPHQILQRKNL